MSLIPPSSSVPTVTPSSPAAFDEPARMASLPEVRKEGGCCSSKVVTFKPGDQLIFDPKANIYKVFRRSCFECDCLGKERVRNERAWEAMNRSIIATAGQQLAEQVYRRTGIHAERNAESGVKLTYGAYTALKNSIDEVIALQGEAITICKKMRILDTFANTTVKTSRVELDIEPEDRIVSPRGSIPMAPTSGGGGVSFSSHESAERRSKEEHDPAREGPKGRPELPIKITVLRGRDPTDSVSEFDPNKIVKTLRDLPYSRLTISIRNAEEIAGQVQREVEAMVAVSLQGTAKVSRDDLTRRVVTHLKGNSYNLKQPVHWTDWKDVEGGAVGLNRLAKKGIGEMSSDELTRILNVAQEFRNGTRDWGPREATERRVLPARESDAGVQMGSLSSSSSSAPKRPAMAHYRTFTLQMRSTIKDERRGKQCNTLGNIFDRDRPATPVEPHREPPTHPLSLTAEE